MSTSFSFSAPHHTKEDEERELAELTVEDKEKILDDTYGRRTESQRNNNINDDDNDDGDSDITDDLLTQFDIELELLPREIMSDYMMACVVNPDVVINESHVKRFLRACNCNAERAAHQLVGYWKMRVHLFGWDNAFEPMTLKGAMKDVVTTMIQIPNFVRILPDDDHGRTVICIDKTNILYKDHDEVSLLKIIWFVFHLALERQATQINGIVLIVINKLSAWDVPSFNFIKLASKSVYEWLPIKIKCTHPCLSSLIATCVAPVYKFCMSRDARQRFPIHNCLSNPTLLKELETFGLHSQNLPKSIGGNYNEQPTWLNECKQIIKEQNTQRDRQKRQREER